MDVECNPIFSEVDKLISLLGKSKLLHILYILHLKEKPLSFSDIKRLVDSSSTTVSRRLRELEDNNLVNRTSFSTRPVTVYYTLTQIAQLLAPTIQSMYDWVENHNLKLI
ncbi:MAG: transcriptional regulator [Candidatus Poseidoniales archaeon]|nr:MAG: transcriptional regulator [Candidatus Poseidoniales archaeon]